MKDYQLTDLQTPYQTPSSDLEQAKSKGAEYAEFSLFSTKGRVGRIRYLAYSLLQLVILAIAGQIMLIVSGNNVANVPDSLGMIMFIIVVIMSGISFILTVQRLHDVNISGLFILLGLIPIINLLFLLLLVIPGTDGPNRFGLPSKPITT